MRLTRRGWNNIIIIGVLCFIAIIKLPDLLRERFAPKEVVTQVVTEQASQIPNTVFVLSPDFFIQRVVFPHFTLKQSNGQWQSSSNLSISASELVQRWQHLQGTVVDEATISKLSLQLPPPQTVEVWGKQQAEPIRLTVYALPKFWLFNNGQHWVAVSVAADYLFPTSLSNNK
ncbi:hypothetical protein [Photobacterium leiognathi]|uniref:hypothetical protein n=1 Tax=Photobacterium leiognathi TaxID=553611 RepID=UPI002981B7B1|nr:hypothetical protein [Photobacterium leiognathi]